MPLELLLVFLPQFLLFATARFNVTKFVELGTCNFDIEMLQRGKIISCLTSENDIVLLVGITLKLGPGAEAAVSFLFWVKESEVFWTNRCLMAM